MNDPGYEYRIAPNAPHIVQMCPRWQCYLSDSDMGWWDYMHCDSPDDAQRILALLQADQTVEGVVRE